MQTTLGITGMTCNNCVNHVGKALRAVPGVTTVDVNLPDQRARIEHADEVALSSLFAAVEDAGYTATASGPAK